MVILPRIVNRLSVLALLACFNAQAWAEMPPHGRPGNIRTLPGVSLGVAGGFGDNSSTQQHFYFEGKFSHRSMIVIDVGGANREISDLAINGEVDIEFSGGTLGVYYQLPKFRANYVTLAIRYQEGENEDDSVILSGASRVDLVEERTATEIAVLVEHENWSRGVWQPYAGVGFRVTNADRNISTSGGREITSSDSTENTLEFTAGLHYQRPRLSWFLEGNTSTADGIPWSLQLGLRFGFFHRPESGR